jgi:hypothetical protein
MGGRRQPPCEEELRLVAAVKRALQEFVLNVLVNEALDGSPRKPAEIRRNAQLEAVARQQIDPPLCSSRTWLFRQQVRGGLAF